MAIVWTLTVCASDIREALTNRRPAGSPAQGSRQFPDSQGRERTRLSASTFRCVQHFAGLRWARFFCPVVARSWPISNHNALIFAWRAIACRKNQTGCVSAAAAGSVPSARSVGWKDYSGHPLHGVCRNRNAHAEQAKNRPEAIPAQPVLDRFVPEAPRQAAGG